jgi:DNA adenine methylase
MGYPGGKNGAGVFQRIVTMMPPHDVYIEPFLGGGAVMRLKRPASLNVGLDMSAAAVDAWRSGSLKGAMAIAEPGAAGRSVETSPLFLLGVGDAFSFLRTFPFRGSELVYLDPPYLMSTRSSGKRYDHELTDVDHRRLLRWAIANPCRVMISGYHSEMYARALQHWRCCRFNAMTRGGVAEEYLWMNFPESVALHDYKYLGENFRERERIKRKKRRWVGRLAKMPLLERRAMLAAIADIVTPDDGAQSL